MFFVFRDSYVIYMWVMNILCTFHIFMYGYVTALLPAGRAGCGTDLAECVSAAGDFLWPQGGRSPRLLPTSGGVIAWGTPNKENADGAEGIFGHAGCVSALALRSNPPKKALCRTCPFGGASNKYRSSCSKHLTCLRVRWTKETLLRDLDTFVWHFISPCWAIHLLSPNNRS